MKKNIILIILAVIFSIILWISITLSNSYYSSVTIPLKFNNLNENYTVTGITPPSLTVRIKSNGWNLMAFLFRTTKDYIVNINEEKGDYSIKINNNSVENQFLSSGIEVIDIKPDIVQYKVDRVFQKKVKISPFTELTFKSNYGLATPIQLIPDSVVIEGPYSLIKNIDSVFTDKITAEDLDEKSYLDATIKQVDGISFNLKDVKVIADVQKIVDKNFKNINIVIENKPEDVNIILLPNIVELSVRGGIDYLGKMNSHDIKAYINYYDVIKDTLGSIKVNTSLPYNSKLLFVKPERIKYIIKTYK